MSIVSIRTALQTKLAAMTPSMPTAWENSKYDPADDTPWQQINLLPAEPENPTICADSILTIESGIFQVLLHYPLFTGPNAAGTRAELIKTTFPRGLNLVYSGVTVVIEKTPTIAPSFEHKGWHVTPVSIHYYSHIFS